MNETLGSYTLLLEVRTVIKFLHIISVCIGIGCATALYFYAVRFFMMRRITPDSYRIFKFFSAIVNYALIIIWASGVAALVNWYYTDPNLLLNEKVWGKVCIVIVLTINGVTVHRLILDTIKKNIGKTLFYRLPRSRVSLFLTTGIVSSVSWYTACAVALTSSLNFNSEYDVIFISYGIVCLTIIVTVNAFALFIKRYFFKRYLAKRRSSSI